MQDLGVMAVLQRERHLNEPIQNLLCHVTTKHEIRVRFRDVGHLHCEIALYHTYVFREMHSVCVANASSQITASAVCHDKMKHIVRDEVIFVLDDARVLQPLQQCHLT